MNKEQKDFFNKVIKQKLIEMAIDGSLPSDMTELQDSHFEEEAEAYNNSADSFRKRKVDALKNFICDDEDRYQSIEEALDLLEAQSEIDGEVDADDIVMV